MKFRFRLRSVLRVRKRAEEQHAQALARATHAMTDAAHALAAERSRLASARESLALAGHLGVRGADIQHLAATIDATASGVDGAREQLATEAAHVDATRTELVEAARRREALERLEEQQRTAAVKLAEGEARRALDDMVSIYHLWRGARREQGGSS